MMQPLHSALQGTLRECHGECTAASAGHDLSLMRQRLAAATPSRWQDAVVISVSPAGWVEIAFLADDRTAVLWNHADLTGTISTGDPVAVHSVYDVLAVGGAKHNVLRADSN